MRFNRAAQGLAFAGTLRGFLLAATASAALTGSVGGLARADGGQTASPRWLIEGGWRLAALSGVSAGGAEISRNGFEGGSWAPATVPGTVLTSLVNNGVYPEPLYGENNRPDRIPDTLSRTSYWYRSPFDVPAEFAGRHVWLNFGGVNYTAEVWVNGHKAGEVRGAFSRGLFDITPMVEPGRKSVVAVLVRPPPHPGDHAEKTQATGTGHNGGVLSQDGPTFLCSQGWDWIPTIRDRDTGIWQSVWLTSTGPVAVGDSTVESSLPNLESADLTIETRVRNVSGTAQSGVLTGTFEDGGFYLPLDLKPGETRLIRVTPKSAPTLHLAHPRLWWPNGYGAPNLYTLRLSFLVSGALSDSRELDFGVRRIECNRPGSPNLTISVNGVPVMCRGGDWGMDEAMKRIPRERLEAQIRMHQIANCNIIRNWVGQSTSEDFYDLCDRHGIMVWDEFFEPNPYDSGRSDMNDSSKDVLDVPLYLENVREKLLRFRQHPCIALWGGRNEGDPAPEAVAAGILRLTSELDPSRFYQPNSADGRGVRSGGPYCWRTPREFYSAPIVPADPGSGAPASGPELEPFKTEIGSMSVPTLESVQGMMPEKDWNTINDDWAEHDLCRGAQEGRDGPIFPEMLAKRYGPWAGLPEFVRKSQLANYESFRAMYEGRFAKLFAPCTGVITWMSNPAQPSFVWQLYSYDLEPNASLFAVKKACEPVHVQMNESDFHVMVVNQTPARLQGLVVRIRVVNLDGSVEFDRTMPAMDARPSAATDAGAVPFPAGVSAVHFVKLELRDGSGRLVSDNFYWRALPGSPDDLTALDTLPACRIEASLERRDAEGKCLIEVKLSNPTNTIALMAHIQLRRGASGQRVLPVYYSDNYLSLLPGESRTIAVEAPSRALGGEQPLVVVDGWNVAVRGAAFAGGAAVAANTAALCGPWTGAARAR